MLPYLPPPPPDFAVHSTTDLPPPLYSLAPAKTSQSGLEVATNGDAVVDQVTERAQGLHSEQDGTSLVPSGQNGSGHAIMEAGTTWAVMRKNQRMTPEGWWQDVREIELDLEDPSR